MSHEWRKWRKKPTVIEAVRWDGGNIGEVMSLGPMRGSVEWSRLFIDTPEGQMRADPGDWIIKGIKGEFYPCKPDIFMALHEPESSASSSCAAITKEEWTAISGLLNVAQKATFALDDSEETGEGHVVQNEDAVELTAALDALEELPAEPGYTSSPRSNAAYALRRLLESIEDEEDAPVPESGLTNSTPVLSMAGESTCAGGGSGPAKPVSGNALGATGALADGAKLESATTQQPGVNWDDIDDAVQRHKLDTLSTVDTAALIVRLERELAEERERNDELSFTVAYEGLELRQRSAPAAPSTPQPEAPTPRTAEAIAKFRRRTYTGACVCVDAEDMAQLERELAVEKNRLWHMEAELNGARALSSASSASAEPKPCCQKYETCLQPCTPRGRWQVEQEFARSSTAAPEAARLLHQEAQSFLHPLAMGLPEVKEFAHKVSRYLEATALSATEASKE